MLHRISIFTLTALTLFSAGCVMGEGEPASVLETNWYQRAFGGPGVYLVQRPVKPSLDPKIFVYMHGAGKTERQGMELFPALRKWCEEEGVILVSPRDYEFTHLMKDLRKRYGEGAVYLAGASKGARMVFGEVRHHPDTYAGLFLIGPALSMRAPTKGEVTIPTYMVYGTEDGRLTTSANLVAKTLRQQGTPLKTRVIKGEGHEAPYPDQSWWAEALEFVVGPPAK